MDSSLKPPMVDNITGTTPLNNKSRVSISHLNKSIPRKLSTITDNMEESRLMYKLVDSYSKPGDNKKEVSNSLSQTSNNYSIKKENGELTSQPLYVSHTKRGLSTSGVGSPKAISKLSGNISNRRYTEEHLADSDINLMLRKTSSPIIFMLKAEIKKANWKSHLPAVSSKESLQKSRLVSGKISDSSKQQIIALSNRDPKGKDVSYIASDTHLEAHKNFADTARSRFRGVSNSYQESRDGEKLAQTVYQIDKTSQKLSTNIAKIHTSESLSDPIHAKKSPGGIAREFLKLDTSEMNYSIEDILKSMNQVKPSKKISDFDNGVKNQTYFDLFQSYELMKLRDTNMLLSLYHDLPHCLQNMPSNKKETELLRCWFTNNRLKGEQAVRLALAEVIRQVFVGYTDRGRLILDVVNQLEVNHRETVKSLNTRIENMNEQYERRVQRCEDVFQETIKRSIEKMSTLDLQVSKLTKELKDATEKVTHLEAMELR